MAKATKTITKKTITFNNNPKNNQDNSKKQNQGTKRCKTCGRFL